MLKRASSFFLCFCFLFVSCSYLEKQGEINFFSMASVGISITSYPVSGCVLSHVSYTQCWVEICKITSVTIF
jgi:hypothetical protein